VAQTRKKSPPATRGHSAARILLRPGVPLYQMKLNELQAKFAEVIGKKTRSPNKTFLVRKITEVLQAAGSGSRSVIDQSTSR
jgi:hypothetical protein